MPSRAEHSAGWAKGPQPTSLPINGELMRELRLARSLTQEQFADLAGYSTRLIRKAEAGLPLKADTIEVLAAALSTAEVPISPETLVTDLRSVVGMFTKAYAHDELQLAAKSQLAFAPNVTYKMAGDPAQIPFAGEYHGLDGVDNWAKAFFATCQRPFKDIYRPVLYQAGTSVIAVGHDAVQILGHEEISYSVTVVRFEFERGRVVLADNDYDTHGMADLLRRHPVKPPSTSADES